VPVLHNYHKNMKEKSLKNDNEHMCHKLLSIKLGKKAYSKILKIANDKKQ